MRGREVFDVLEFLCFLENPAEAGSLKAPTGWSEGIIMFRAPTMYLLVEKQSWECKMHVRGV